MNPLSRLQRIFLLSFVESFSGVLLQRGLYFYTHDVLGFDSSKNLWLALLSGVAYVIGAVASHPVSERWGERRLLMLTLAGALGMHLLIMQSPTPWMLTAAFPAIALFQGFKWPVVESFLSAGLKPVELARTLSRFNVVWAASVPVGLVTAGQLIGASYPGALFAAAAASNALSIAVALPLPARPEHLPEEHPDRPTDAELEPLRDLLGSARWCMLSSYALMFLLAPLMPNVFAALGVDLAKATAAAGLLDVARLVAFAALGASVGWHGRGWPHVAAVVALPIGFALVLLGKSLLWVLLGEVAFGIAAGFVYTASLYYALLLKNASVDAGGAHEGLIGTGFALGPIAGLIGAAATPWFGNSALSLLACSAPMTLVFALLSLRPLVHAGIRLRARVPNSNS